MLGGIQAAISATVAAAEFIGAAVALAVVLINGIQTIKNIVRKMGEK